MLSFFRTNLGTIAVSLALAAAAGLIIAKLIRDKRRGICPGCDASCGGCVKTSSQGRKSADSGLVKFPEKPQLRQNLSLGETCGILESGDVR